MSEEIDLTEVTAMELIDELENRGHTVDRDSDIDDFTVEQLRRALGYTDDDDDADWDSLFNLFHTRKDEYAIKEIKRIIQQKTGRILV